MEVVAHRGGCGGGPSYQDDSVGNLIVGRPSKKIESCEKVTEGLWQNRSLRWEKKQGRPIFIHS